MPNYSTKLANVSTLRLDDELLKRIEEWRQKWPEPPSAAQAVRWLIRLGLTADGK